MHIHTHHSRISYTVRQLTNISNCISFKGNFIDSGLLLLLLANQAKTTEIRCVMKLHSGMLIAFQ